VVTREFNHYSPNYRCMRQSADDDKTNSRAVEVEKAEVEKKAAHMQKVNVVIISIIASAGLMILKLSIGVLTNSLGILSEAMHSGLDFIAALMTLYAIRMILRPSDLTFTYGYGKFESLSSLAQIILLFVVAGWISYEGFNRIFFEDIRPEITIYSFLVMAVSIGIDYGRSRALYKAARKFDSQALEADGLHFKTDMFSSAIVIAGLLVALLSDIPNADAYAAIAVAAVIIYTSLGLGRRTLGVLLDKAPKGIYRQVTEAVSGLDGATRPHNIRIRNIGSETLVEMHIEVPRTFTHDRAHKVATSIEQKIKHLLPSSEVLVHVDATESANETIFDKIRLVAAETEGIRNVHSIHLSKISSPLLTSSTSSPLSSSTQDDYHAGLNEVDGKSFHLSDKSMLHLYLDVQMGLDLDLNTAHSIVDSFEARLKNEIPQIGDVTTHLEIESPIEGSRMTGTEKRVNHDYLQKIKEAVLSVDEVVAFKDIRVFDNVNGEQHITLTVNITSKKGSIKTSITLDDAHRIATKVQNMIIDKTEATRVVVHTETTS
jgi:cation diffusion facilitator family transporter